MRVAHPEFGSWLQPERGQIHALQHLTDPQLLDLYRASRNDAAFEEVVRRHGRLVWGVCRRVLTQQQDIEDAFQAVFVILARKCEMIRKGEALGSWLYGVAFRTAVRAKQAGLRRKELERPVAEEPAPAAWSEAACRELQRVLDEEVQRLAEKYRAPFILCCLEGMSRTEAALELGWKEGTLSGRLARARLLLQKRLLRRGVTLSAALTAAALTHTSVAGEVPGALYSTIAKAVKEPAGSGPSALSSGASQLADLVVPTLGVIRVKSLIGLLLLITLGVVAASVASLNMGKSPIREPVQAAPAATAPRLLLGHSGSVHNVLFTSDGRLASAGGWPDGDRTLRVWDGLTGNELSRFLAPAQIQSLDVSANGRLALLGLNDGRILHVDLDGQRLVQELHGHHGIVSWIGYTPDGQRAFSTAIDGTARLWSLADGTEIRRFQGLSKWVRAGAVSRDGKRLVIGHNDGVVQLWDTETGAEVQRLERRCGWINWLAFTPDGRHLLIADREAALYDLVTGKLVRLFAGHGDDVQQLALAPNGALLLTASYDGDVRLWDFQSGSLLRRLASHDGFVFSVAWAPDGRHIASAGGGHRDGNGYRGGADNAVRFWDLSALLSAGP